MTHLMVSEWQSGADRAEAVDALASLLYAVVHDGASVGFVLPFPVEEARTFWRERVFPAVEAGARRLWIARTEAGVVGTVQLIVDTMPNQRHRAEIAKLLVHPGARRMGIGRALMVSAETAAGEMGRTLLTLDTRTGDSGEPLYRSLGYVAAGTIPGYARAPQSDVLEATTVMYKVIGV